MGDFVSNPNATLPGPKRDRRSLPQGTDANQYLDAASFNALRDAANDLRSAFRARALQTWEVADATARLALVPTPADVGRVARQLDDESMWQCTGAGPASWRPIDIRRADRGMPWVLLYRTQSVGVVAPPGTVLLNEVVDLGRWGTVCDQYRVQFDVVATTLDGGVRRATCGPEDTYSSPQPPGTRPTGPAGDAPIPGIYAAALPLMDVAGTPEEAADPAGHGMAARTSLPSQAEVDSYGVDLAGSMGIEVGNYGPENRCRFVRLVIARTSTPLTPEQEAALVNHQVHINVTGPDSVVASWDVPIPATQNTMMLDQLIDLRDFSAGGPLDNFTFLLEFLRGGQTINLAHPVTWDGQGDFDPPTYPVRVNFSGWVDTPTRDYEYNENNTKSGPHILGVYGGLGEADRFDGGIWRGQKVAYCTENMRSLIRMHVWRDVSSGDRDGDGPATYVKTPGGGPVAIPPGAKDGCTLRVKLVRAPEFCTGLYPFQQDGNRPSTWEHRSRIAALEGRVAQHDSTILGAIKSYDVSATPLPAPEAAAVSGRFALRSDTNKPGAPVEPLMAVPGHGWIRIGHLAVKGDWNSGQKTGTGSMQEHPLPAGCWANPEAVEVVPVSWPAGAAFQPVVNVVPCVLGVTPAKVQVTVAVGVVYEVRTFGWAAP